MLKQSVMKYNMLHKYGHLLFFFLLVGWVSGLRAQVVYNAADTTSLPEVSLREVEITAMRESGRLSLLPLSAGVLDRAMLEQQNVGTMKQASHYIANLFMPDYGSRLTSPVYIRGVGSRINAPSVGLYVDNIPYFEKSVFDFDLLNAERIEVLRGPQGTLYGRNTMGGLINVYSQSPFRHEGTDLTLSGGNPGHVNGTLSHAQRLTDKLALSASVGVNSHQGFFRNEYLDKMADAHLSAGARVRLAWQINASLMAELTTHFEHLDQGGYPYAIHDSGAGITSAVNYNEPSSYQRLMSSNGLVFSYTTPAIRLQAVSAFQYFDDNQSIDQDFTVADLVFAVQTQDQYMLSQEFTARSNHQRNYQWVFGAFGFRQQLDHKLGINFGEDAVAMRMVPGMLTRRQQSANLVRGAAVFHQSTLQHFMLNGLSLTAGLRLDYEDASLDHQAMMEAAFPTPPPVAFLSTMDFFQLLPRLALNYTLSEYSSLFGAMVRGYKTGGFNVVFESDDDRSFDPEYSWNYELGYKGRLWENRLSLQTSLFYIDWKNQQIYQLLPSGQGSMLKNAGASVSKGFELDAEAVPVKNLYVTGSFGYTHATFSENSPNPETDLSGNFIPYIPRYTLFTGVSYRHPMKNSFLDAIRMQVNYRQTGTHYWNDANTFSQEAYGILNLMLSLETGDLRLDVFANNVTGVDYHAFSFAALGNHYVQQGRPATFGVNVRYGF
jgi:iron complex outermembrane recepter protein